MEIGRAPLVLSNDRDGIAMLIWEILWRNGKMKSKPYDSWTDFYAFLSWETKLITRNLQLLHVLRGSIIEHLL
jgi:hypothetical protein